MIIFTTTYHVAVADARQLVIYLREVYIPAATRSGQLSHERLARVLSHHDEGSECFTLEFHVPDTATLHHWYAAEGARLGDDLAKTFKGEVAGLTTLLEIID